MDSQQSALTGHRQARSKATMSKAVNCPTCGTPLEWSRKDRRYLACHESPEATALIRQASKARRDTKRRKELAAENRRLLANQEMLTREVKDQDLLISDLTLELDAKRRKYEALCRQLAADAL